MNAYLEVTRIQSQTWITLRWKFALETAYPKPKKPKRRSHARYGYSGYPYYRRAPYYHWHPRFWWPFYRHHYPYYRPYRHHYYRPAPFPFFWR